MARAAQHGQPAHPNRSRPLRSWRERNFTVDCAVHVQHAVVVQAEEEASFDCPNCGERIVVPVDVHAGEEQQYVEDCPVCCNPVVLSVHVDEDGAISIDAQAE